MPVAFIGLGSNSGNKLRNIWKAALFLNRIKGVDVLKVSPVYETDPVGKIRQDKFLNAVVMIKTALKAIDLLEKCKGIEKLLKRVKTKKWGPRTIDLDILVYGNKILKTKNLTVPHKEMHKRKFVLIPLLKIAPELKHPVLKKKIKDILKNIKDKGRVKIKWKRL